MSERRLDMKKCKECGKMFIPRSARQQYCDDIHYRPCPICGKLVEAKYLSDPARRCDDCKHVPNKSKSSNAVKQSDNPKLAQPKKVTTAELLTPEVLERALDGEIPENDLEFTKEEILENPVVAVYAGRPVCGFKKGCTYIIKTNLTEYSYLVQAIQNISEGSICDNVSMSVSSMTSFNQSFVKPVYQNNDRPTEDSEVLENE